MSRDVNFLLGNGEKLTGKVDISSGGGDKNPPYTISEVKHRISKELTLATREFSLLPALACPDDNAVGVVTIHPRYTSKSSFPSELFKKAALEPLGSRSKRVHPINWGTKTEPFDGYGVSEEIFVAGTRESFSAWNNSINDWDEASMASKQLVEIEQFSAFKPEDKNKVSDEANVELCLEAVLHSSTSYLKNAKKTNELFEAFEAYAEYVSCKPVMDYRRNLKNILFLPVFAPKSQINELAKFAFVRVLRGMPAMRPFDPSSILRQVENLYSIQLPEQNSLDKNTHVTIFDGGIRDRDMFSKWVSYAEPTDVGNPVPALQQHGEGVTSAFLFGPISSNGKLPIPICDVTHVRVLGENRKHPDLECYDVLDRIVDYCKTSNTDFVNLSLGPDMAVDDNDITRWTAEMDELSSRGKRLIVVAAGNNGDRDSITGEDRIQPPADGVNVLSVGACGKEGETVWKRACYSATGPGRSPGFVKPDGVAFGGTQAEMFHVVSSRNSTRPVAGTSFSSPYALRSAVAARSQLGDQISLLTIRALMLHRADRQSSDCIEVGWG